MQVCSDGHDEIVHDNRECPLCLVIREKQELEKDIENLQEEIKELQNE